MRIDIALLQGIGSLPQDWIGDPDLLRRHLHRITNHGNI